MSMGESQRASVAAMEECKCDIHGLPSWGRCESCLRTRSVPSASQAVKHRQNPPMETNTPKRVKRASEQCDKMLETRFFLPRELDVSAELQSLAQLYDDYTMHSNLWILDSLSPLQTSDSIGFFRHAIKAASLASAARQHLQSGLMAKARAEYVQAMAKANAALRDEYLMEDDSLLAGVFWAGMFEVLVTDRVATNSIPDVHGCHPHINGALALLQLRAKRNLVAEVDKATYVFIRHTVLMGFLASLGSLGADTKSWFQFESFHTSWTASVGLDPVVREAVNIWTCAHIVIAKPKNKIEEEKAFKLAEWGLKAAKDLSDVADSIDVSAAEDHSGQRLFNGVLNSSTRTNRTVARSLYRSVQVHVLEAMLQLLQTSQYATYRPSITGNLESKFRGAIAIGLDAIYEDVINILAFSKTKDVNEKLPGLPYRGMWALWGIIVVLRSPFAGTKQKALAREQGGLIANRTGIGRATLVTAL